jgi:hypothetical protein
MKRRWCRHRNTSQGSVAETQEKIIVAWDRVAAEEEMTEGWIWESRIDWIC